MAVPLSGYSASYFAGTAIGIVICTLLGALTAEQPLEAWWLRAQFEPSMTQYETLKAKDIDQNWSKFSILSYSKIPAEAKSSFAWMKKHGFVFSREGDFNGDGILDKAIAGVYVNSSGTKGRFLLVLEQKKPHKWSKAFLHQMPGEAGFSVIFGKGKALFWGPCMQCGEYGRLRWKEDHYIFDEELPDED